MLQSLRNQAKSWVIKVVLLLIIVSFAIWGIGDIFRDGGHGTIVAEVGDVPISANNLNQTFQQDLQQIRLRFGQNMTTDNAIQLGLLDASLEQLISQVAFDNFTTDLGIRPGDESVANAVRSNPAFQDSFGQFDHSLVTRSSMRAGLSEAEYTEVLRGELARDHVAAVSRLAAPPSPSILDEALTRYRGETRTIDYVRVGANSIEPPTQATESELREYYNDHQLRFTAPERRTLQTAVLNAADLEAEIAIGTSELEAAYEDQIDRFTVPESRLVEQILVDDQETAQAVADQAGSSTDFAAIAAGIDGAIHTSLGRTTAGQLPPAIGAAVFALSDGGTSQPVETAFGWHVLRASDFEDAVVEPFDAVRDALEQDLRTEKALNQLFEFANRFDDLLAGGASLAEATAALGISVETLVDVDAAGTLTDGTQPPVPAWNEVVATAFALSNGETSNLIESETSYVAVSVTSISEPTVEPFDSVRDAVGQALAAERIDAALTESAAALAERAAPPSTLRLSATTADLTILTSEPISRDGANLGDLPRSLTSSLFDADGDNAIFTVAEGDAVIVAQIVDVNVPDSSSTTASSSGPTVLIPELTAQLLAAARSRYSVSINRALLNDMYAPAPASDY